MVKSFLIVFSRKHTNKIVRNNNKTKVTSMKNHCRYKVKNINKSEKSIYKQPELEKIVDCPTNKYDSQYIIINKNIEFRKYEVTESDWQILKTQELWREPTRNKYKTKKSDLDNSATIDVLPKCNPLIYLFESLYPKLKENYLFGSNAEKDKEIEMLKNILLNLEEFTSHAEKITPTPTYRNIEKGEFVFTEIDGLKYTYVEPQADQTNGKN